MRMQGEAKDRGLQRSPPRQHPDLGHAPAELERTHLLFKASVCGALPRQPEQTNTLWPETPELSRLPAPSPPESDFLSQTLTPFTKDNDMRKMGSTCLQGAGQAELV